MILHCLFLNVTNSFSVQGHGFDFKPYVHPIYNAIMARLTNQDQDQVSFVTGSTVLDSRKFVLCILLTKGLFAGG